MSMKDITDNLSKTEKYGETFGIEAPEKGDDYQGALQELTAPQKLSSFEELQAAYGVSENEANRETEVTLNREIEVDPNELYEFKFDDFIQFVIDGGLSQRQHFYTGHMRFEADKRNRWVSLISKANPVTFWIGGEIEGAESSRAKLVWKQVTHKETNFNRNMMLCEVPTEEGLAYVRVDQKLQDFVNSYARAAAKLVLDAQANGTYIMNSSPENPNNIGMKQIVACLTLVKNGSAASSHSKKAYVAGRRAA